MGLYSPVTPPSPHLYPQELQLKLYQAFIFSIPILFTIILVLLFYLFYLKRRASTFSSSLPTSASFNQSASDLSAVCQVGLKEKLSEKLQVVSFDEELRLKESQCCVCLGDFEMKEELLQISSCRHLFHMDCIRHWLLNNSTCPICRCFVIPTSTKLNNVPSQSSGDNTALAAMTPLQQNMVQAELNQVAVSMHVEQRQEEDEHVAISPVVEHQTIRIVEGPSSSQ